MKYVSIDLETTGLNPENDQILEFSAIVEDTTKQLSFQEIPKFTAILNQKRIVGNPYAINLNSRIINILANIPTINTNNQRDKYIKKYNIIDQNLLGKKFADFLSKHFEFKRNKDYYYIIAAGTNFSGFDKLFLNKLDLHPLGSKRFSDYVKFHHRVINTAERFIDFENDIEPPSLDECMKRGGIDEICTHKAEEDAWNVIRVLRTTY